MTALLALVRKDLILLFSDRRALLLNLAMPILLGAFFGYLTNGAGSKGNTRIAVAVVLLDTSETANKIAAGLRAESALKLEELSLDDAQQKVRKGDLQAAIVIPAGFGEAAGAALLGVGVKPPIPILYDPSQVAVLAMLKGMLTQQVMQAVGSGLFRGLPSALPVANADAGMSLPFATQEQPVTAGPRYNGFAHSFAGMSVQFILFMAINAGIDILLARRHGLWTRLLAAPVGLPTILAARAVSIALIAFGTLCVIFAAGRLFFDVRINGSVPGFVGIGLCFSIVTATFGLMIAAFGRTPEAARGLAVAVTLIMAMLGGAWMPAFLFPQWLQSLTLAVPVRWAVDGLDAMTWRGLGVEAALPPMAALLGFAVLFGVLAGWKFHAERHRAS